MQTIDTFCLHIEIKDKYNDQPVSVNTYTSLTRHLIYWQKYKMIYMMHNHSSSGNLKILHLEMYSSACCVDFTKSLSVRKKMTSLTVSLQITCFLWWCIHELNPKLFIFIFLICYVFYRPTEQEWFWCIWFVWITIQKQVWKQKYTLI